jgi:hypothetical protein
MKECALTSSWPSRDPPGARIPTEQGFGPVSSVGSTPTTGLLQSRTTTRLYFWAARPWVLFGDEEVYDRAAGKAEKEPYFAWYPRPKNAGALRLRTVSRERAVITREHMAEVLGHRFASIPVILARAGVKPLKRARAWAEAGGSQSAPNICRCRTSYGGGTSGLLEREARSGRMWVEAT